MIEVKVEPEKQVALGENKIKKFIAYEKNVL